MRIPVLTLLVLCACPPKQDPKPVPDAGLTAQQAKDQRAACAFTAGALPSDTLAGDTKLGDQLPFDHIVLVMQENRSFDHYFSKLSHGGVVVAPADATTCS